MTGMRRRQSVRGTGKEVRENKSYYRDENSLLCVGHSGVCGVFIHWRTHCSQLKLSLYMNHKKWFMYAHTKLIVPVNNTLMPWQ